MEASSPAGRAPAEQREWEERSGKTAGACAFLSAALIIAAFAYQIAKREPTDNEREFLIQLGANKADYLIPVVLSSLSLLAIAPVLLYLYRVTRYRRAQMLPAAGVLGVLGPIVLALLQVVLHLDRADTADTFLASGAQTNTRAEDLLKEGVGPYVGVGYGANLALGFALVMIGLNAMRAGILSRFMAVLGIVLGALYVLPLGPTPLIQIFWLTALGALLVNRWPGGRGPAWEAMEEVPWPTAAQIAEHRRAAEDGAAPPEDREDVDPEPKMSAAPGARSRKRRKRRR